MALKGVVTFLLLLCITSRVLSLSCPGPCVRANCDLSRAQGCTAGILEGGDACGCCDVCAKDIGEVCGGPWDTSGICANWLTCLKDTSIPNFEFNAEGTCVREFVPKLCDESGEPTFCAFDLVPTCGSNGVTYEGSCGFASAKCKNPTLEVIPCDEVVPKLCDQFGEPTFCAFDLVPTCGSNGVTYEGSCGFASAKCKNPTLEVIPCGDRSPSNCDAFGEPTFCAFDQIRTCGSNGVTYGSSCEFASAKCKIPSLEEIRCDLAGPRCEAPGSGCPNGLCKEACDYANGEYNAPFQTCGGSNCTCCVADDTCHPNGSPCQGVIGGTCRGRCEPGEVEQGSCSAQRVADVAECICCRKVDDHCSGICTADYSPVCGSDGQTYSNECVLNGARCRNPSDNIVVAHKGECRDGTAEFEQRFIVLGQNKGVTWQRARTLCQDAGYDLADLANPHIDATRLASYLLTKHNLRYYWLGGKGQGSNIAYLSGQVLEPQSPLWRKPDHGFQSSTNYCMYIRDDGNPNPLGTFNCQDNTYMVPLCEVSGQTPPAAPASPLNFPGK